MLPNARTPPEGGPSIFGRSSGSHLLGSLCPCCMAMLLAVSPTQYRSRQHKHKTCGGIALRFLRLRCLRLACSARIDSVVSARVWLLDVGTVSVLGSDFENVPIEVGDVGDRTAYCGWPWRVLCLCVRQPMHDIIYDGGTSGHFSRTSLAHNFLGRSSHLLVWPATSKKKSSATTKKVPCEPRREINITHVNGQ